MPRRVSIVSPASTVAPEALGERGEQRAKALPAECRRVALGGARNRTTTPAPRSLPQLNGPSTNSIVAAPIAEIVRHRLLARHIGLARDVGDGARGAHLGGEKILELAFARIAPADAHLLARRRRIDVDAAARRELGQRVDVGQVDPMRAAVERHAEGCVSVMQRPPIWSVASTSHSAGRRRRSCARRRCRRRRRRR